MKMQDLKVGQCVWPIGDPRDDDFHFCGKRCQSETIYCDLHSDMAYATPANRARHQKRATSQT